MFDYKVIAKEELDLISILEIKIDSILEWNCPISKQTLIERIHSLIPDVKAGEWQIVIEEICTNFCDFDIPITRDIYKRILDIANELQMDKSSLGLDNLIVID